MDLFEKQEKINEPSSLVIIGKPKQGKTSIVSQLPNSVILDYENGSKYIEHDRIIDVNKHGINLWSNLQDIKGKYDFGVIDTLTSLEEYLSKIVVSDYNAENKTEYRALAEIPYGGGYGIIRQRLVSHINYLKTIFKRIILLGHTKEKHINSNNIVLDLALAGKSADIVLSLVDSISFLKREKTDESSNAMLHFSETSSDVGGSRFKKLDGKMIVISKLNNKNELTTNWKEVFPDTIK